MHKKLCLLLVLYNSLGASIPRLDSKCFDTEEGVQTLINQYGINPKIYENELLCIAIFFNKPQALQQLLEAAKHSHNACKARTMPNLSEPFQKLTCCGLKPEQHSFSRLLLHAAKKNHGACLATLLEDTHESVNTLIVRGNYGDDCEFKTTPLLEACGEQALDCVKLLLQHNADPLIKDSTGRDALLRAYYSLKFTTKNQKEIIIRLMKQGSKLNKEVIDYHIRCCRDYEDEKLEELRDEDKRFFFLLACQQYFHGESAFVTLEKDIIHSLQSSTYPKKDEMKEYLEKMGKRRMGYITTMLTEIETLEKKIEPKK